jgi:nucleotide-binding universal stress UspA family protein
MRVLLAVDGSDPSYDALRALAHLAPAESVTVLHVVHVPKPAYPEMMPEAAEHLYASMERSMKEDGARLLDRVKALTPPLSGPIVTRLETGRPAEVILAVAEQERSGLLVLGSRGLGPVKELLYGSVSHRVLTHAPCATLAVAAPMRSLRHMLLALQGRQDADRVVRFLGQHPFHTPPAVSLLTVVPFSAPPWPADVAIAESMKKDLLDRAGSFLEEVRASLSKLGYRATAAAVMGHPAAEIFEQSARVKPDLLLMGSHGRAGLTRFVLGSVSHTVLHRATCPVLVVR